MNIIKETNPERYGIVKNGKIILMQIDYDNEMVNIVETVDNKKVKNEAKELLNLSFEDFNDEFFCTENGTYDFLIGFKNYLQQKIKNN